MGGSYSLVGSNLERKKSGRIWPDWGNSLQHVQIWPDWGLYRLGVKCGSWN